MSDSLVVGADLGLGAGERPVSRSFLRLRDFAPEALAEIIRGSKLEHHLLNQANCHVSHRRWAWQGFSVDTGRYNFACRVRGQFAEGTVAVGYCRAMRGEGAIWVNGFAVERESVQYYPLGTELNYRAEPDSEWVALEMAPQLLEESARLKHGRSLRLPEGQASTLKVPSVLFAELDRLVQRSLQADADSAAMVPALVDACVDVLLSGDADSMRQAVRRWQMKDLVLKEADDYLMHRLEQGFDGAELAGALGMSERHVQSLFKQAYGLTPARWARCRALHEARARLRDPSWSHVTIEGIAQSCGFQHRGRFAGYYRDLFGESPGETVVP